MRRSGSGQGAVYNRRLTASSSMSAGSMRLAAASSPMGGELDDFSDIFEIRHWEDGAPVTFGALTTGVGLAEDLQRGLIDRFRSLPIAAAAVVGGRSVSDMANAVLGLAVMVAMGLLMGWSWTRGAADAAAAIGLLLLLRFALLWIGIYLGLLARDPEAVSGLFLLTFPVTMVTSAFVAPELMPGWLGTIAEWNPLSATIGATRELFGNPGAATGGGWPAQHAQLLAVLWPLVLVAVFLPLAARRYRAMSR